MDLNIFYFYPFLYYNLSNLEAKMIFRSMINLLLDKLPIISRRKT